MYEAVRGARVFGIWYGLVFVIKSESLVRKRVFVHDVLQSGREFSREQVFF